MFEAFVPVVAEIRFQAYQERHCSFLEIPQGLPVEVYLASAHLLLGYVSKLSEFPLVRFQIHQTFDLPIGYYVEFDPPELRVPRAKN